jgi:protein O-GlcNAc transferase
MVPLNCHTIPGRLPVSRTREWRMSRSMHNEALLDAARQAETAGLWREAESLYLQFLERDPEHASIWHALAELALRRDAPDLAVTALSEALAREPNDVTLLARLADACRQAGYAHRALAAELKIADLLPGTPDPQLALARTFADQGLLTEAIRSMQLAAKDLSNDPEFQHRFAQLLLSAGDVEGAKVLLRTLLLSDLREHPKVALDLGVALSLADGASNGELEDLRTQLLTEHSDLLATLQRQCAAAQRAREMDEVMTALRRAWFVTPGDPATLNGMFSWMYGVGRITEALALHRQAAALQPNNAELHSYGVFVRTADPSASDRDILEDARAWQARFTPEVATFPHYKVSPEPQRRLRVGYVSATFCFHSTLYFIVPLLRHHNRAEVEVVCYSSLAKPDAGTARVRALADEWHDVVDLDDAALAQRVFDDRIDILVDLSLHTTGNRLLAFAHKPAPVQVTWLAYPGTSGLSAMDYRFTDNHFDPPEDLEREANYSETSLRLPASYWCYDPLTETPDVAPLPAATNGGVTFASFNGLSKVNDDQLRLWARVLHSVPNSRLVIVAPPGETRARIRAFFMDSGIKFSRVELIDYRGRDLYLQFHSQVDILLDTFPYAGGLTSLEAIWMGVPVVTLAGSRVASRGGASINANLDLHRLIARSPDEYVAIAARLAADLPALAALRASLRQRLQQSPLMDAPRFARDVEAAYRTIWQRWCAQSS